MMVKLQPVIKASVSFGRNWGKPVIISSEELEAAVDKVRREKIPYKEALVVPLKYDGSNPTVAAAAKLYWNSKVNKVEVVLLYPLLICWVEG